MSEQTPVADVTLSIRGLSIALPRGADRSHAVQGVDLDVPRGQVVCLVGESGSGKSMVAHAVMGLLPPGVRVDCGSIHLQDEALVDAPAAHLRRLRGTRMAMVFQEPMTALNPVLTCGEQVDELLALHTDLPRAGRRARVIEMLARVQLPDPPRLYSAYPHQLSGGQRQRVMIAMALILKPALLIADEPTTALDVTTQASILELVRHLQHEHDTAVLFITHDFGVVADIADGVAVLERGRLVESGSARDVLHRPRHPYTQALLKAVPTLTPRQRPVPRGRGEAAHVTLEGLSKTYDSRGWFRAARRVTAADAVTFDIERGETLAVVGESGSGKSTVARMVARLLEPTSGTVTFDGAVISGVGARAGREFRRRVQVVFQDPFRSLNPRRTVGAAIAEGPVNFGVPAAAARRRAAELMTMVGLSPDAIDRYPHEFSGGQRQRICIARALAVEPELLIADEAVSALDVSVQAQILDLLDDLQARLHLTLLFITHDLRVAARMADRVVVMHQGRVVEAGAAGDVLVSPQHPYTKALLDAAPGRGVEFGREVRRAGP